MSLGPADHAHGHASHVQAAPRLAPTAKIPDDAPYPQAGVSTRPASIPPGPVSYAPPAIPPPAAPISSPPPGSLAPPSQPAPSISAAPTGTRARPQLSTASASFAVPPRRPVGLIALVLIVDLGLAAAGAVLLAKGLGKSEDKPAPTQAPVEKKTELETTPPASAASGAPAANGAPAASVAASPPAANGAPATSVAASPAPGQPAAARDARAAKRDDKTVAKSSGAGAAAPPPAAAAKQPAAVAEPVTSVPAVSSPQPGAATTPAAPSTADEIDAKIAHARPVFAHCAEQFPAQGKLQFAMQVRGDGRVVNVAPVENSTGNPELAQCIGAEIASWTVSPHGGEPISLFRPFTYP